MMTIRKYPLDEAAARGGGAWVLTMPPGAEILCVQVQDGVPCVWARVDDDPYDQRPRDERVIAVYGTGHANTIGKYIDTFQLAGGNLVFHAFELGAEHDA
jgi:hypothetical protein